MPQDTTACEVSQGRAQKGWSCPLLQQRVSTNALRICLWAHLQVTPRPWVSLWLTHSWEGITCICSGAVTTVPRPHSPGCLPPRCFPAVRFCHPETGLFLHILLRGLYPARFALAPSNQPFLDAWGFGSSSEWEQAAEGLWQRLPNPRVHAGRGSLGPRGIWKGCSLSSKMRWEFLGQIPSVKMCLEAVSGKGLS